MAKHTSYHGIQLGVSHIMHHSQIDDHVCGRAATSSEVGVIDSSERSVAGTGEIEGLSQVESEKDRHNVEPV